jgi:hypothetical protein
MLKSFLLLTAGGFVSSVVGAKTTIVNTSNNPITIIEDSTAQSLIDIEPETAQKVIHSLFSIAPGGIKVLPPNKYILDLPFNGSAVLYIEKPAKKEKPKVEPETPVIVNPPATDEPQV